MILKIPDPWRSSRVEFKNFWLSASLTKKDRDTIGYDKYDNCYYGVSYPASRCLCWEASIPENREEI